MLRKLALISVLLVKFTVSFACPPDVHQAVPAAESALSVKSASMEVEQDGAERRIAVFGVIKNSGEVCFNAVEVEIKFFNAKGEVIDTVVETLYGEIVPPGQDMSFRVLNSAARHKDSYDSLNVKIVDAEPHFGKKREKNESSPLVDLLFSWGPLAVFILIWAFFMRKMAGKNSPQRKTLALMEEQTAAFNAHTTILERIAAALETKFKVNE